MASPEEEAANQALSSMQGANFNPQEGVPEGQAGPVGQSLASIPTKGPLQRYDILQAARGDVALTWAAVPAAVEIALFSKDAPVHGFKSYPDPSRVDPPFVPLLQDLRVDDGTLKARYPTTLTTTSGLIAQSGSAGQPRGLWSGQMNGTTYVVAAMTDSADKVNFFISTDGINFSPCSSSNYANPYGDTRMTDTGVPVHFCQVNEQVSGNDVLVVQNGTNQPLVLTPAGISPHSSLSRFINSILPCSQALNYPTAPSAAVNLPMFNPAYPYLDVTAGHRPYTVSNVAGNLSPTFTANGELEFPPLTASSTDKIQLNWSTPVNFSSCTQLCIAMSYTTGGLATWLLNFKIAIIDTVGGTQVIWDPSPSTATAFYNSAEDLVQGASAQWYDIALNTFSLQNIAAANCSSVNGIIIEAQTTFPTTAPAITYDWGIIGVFGGNATGAAALYGSSPENKSLSSYLIAFENSGTFTESAGVVCEPADSQTPTFASCGMVTSPLNLGNYLPAFQYAQFQIGVPFFNPSLADLANGVDTVNFYRQDSGSSDYLYAFSETVANWQPTLVIASATNASPPTCTTATHNYVTGQTVQVTGATGNTDLNGTRYVKVLTSTTFQLFHDAALSVPCSAGVYTANSGNSAAWVYVNPTSSVQYVIDTVNYLNLTVSRYAPDAYNIPMPVGNAVCWGNTRSFVGGQNFYAGSEQGYPFRHRLVLLETNGVPVARSGFNTPLTGETVQQFATPAGAALGGTTIFFWTNIQTYMFTGFDGFALSQPSMVAKVGTYSPNSIAQYKDAIFFLDDNQEWRRFAYMKTFSFYAKAIGSDELMPIISRLAIDDRSLGIPFSRLPWVGNAILFDKYYSPYTASGGSINAAAVIWEEALQGWMEDRFPVSAEMLCVAPFSTGKQLLAFGSDGNIYVHENKSSSLMQHVNITFPELNIKGWENAFFGRTGILGDVQPTMSITGFTSATPQVATTSAAHGLQTGDVVSIPESGGTNATLVSCYVSVASSTTFSLYYDPAFTNPVPTGTFSGATSGYYSANITKTVKNQYGLPDTDNSMVPMGYNTGDKVWRWDQAQGIVAGIQGASCKTNLNLPMSPGSRIYTLIMESKDAEAGADMQGT